jgi:hypothetical protein
VHIITVAVQRGETKMGRVLHLASPVAADLTNARWFSSIHVGTCLHQHLHNLVVAIVGSHVKGRLTVLQSQGQGDMQSVSAVAYVHIIQSQCSAAKRK